MSLSRLRELPVIRATNLGEKKISNLVTFGWLSLCYWSCAVRLIDCVVFLPMTNNFLYVCAIEEAV